ncbi:MAG: sulfatase-like hydrolase/transferase [Planctomycetales bacterium]|nr:sulfatase-like hydrolase/transferase [Planctomycetales bacterium]
MGLRILTLIFSIQAMLCCNKLLAADRPNIVWLLSEDNSKHFLKLFDEHGAETPNIADMARHGLRFEHAFSNAPVCSVARTTLMTGCYAPRIGSQFHRKSQVVPLPGDLKMFPAYLRAAGYYTTNNQKKDYNAEESADVWDESSRSASWRNRKEDQPFFHMQSFAQSHESSLHFDRQRMESGTQTSTQSVFIPPHHPDTPLFRFTYAHYLDRIGVIDRQIGNVLRQLEGDGVLEDTIVFYFGDHGGVLPGSKGYVNERGLHVPLVIRVPEKWQDLVGRTNGQAATGFVSFVDFGPTVLNLAGVDVPDEMDGRPFLGPNTSADEVDSRNEAFGHADRFDEKYDLVRSIRLGRWKYVRNYQPFNFDGLQNNYRYNCLAFQEWRTLYQQHRLDTIQRQFFETKPVEALYDLASDPYETQNLANSVEHTDTLLRLRSRLQQQLKAWPDLSFIPESELVEDGFANPTEFGAKNQQRIAKLIDIADLSLLPFDEAQAAILQAIESDDALQRYWALIAATSHGDAAAGLVSVVRKTSKEDSNRLVRTRAAEFLALVAGDDPSDVLKSVLSESESGVETLLILNSLVLLKDGATQCNIPFSSQWVTEAAKKQQEVQRRIEYLSP